MAEELNVLLKELPSIIGISERMFYGYRSGKYPITEKAWRKLEASEREAGITATATITNNPTPQNDIDSFTPDEHIQSALHAIDEKLEKMQDQIQEMTSILECIQKWISK